MKAEAPLVGGIELGGTKTAVAVGTPDGTLIEWCHFPTSDPTSTLGRAVAWLRERGNQVAIGVAAFGPVRVNPSASDYGEVLATPKEGWQGFSIRKFLVHSLPRIEVAIETDVNAALWSEQSLGAARGVRNAAYITVGTGIGAGILIDGRMVHGSLHPEFGHLRVPRARADDFPGVCPFHGDCLEGMASGPAIEARWGSKAECLGEDHPAWEMESWYLAQGILALLAIVSPERVIVGGGVAQAEGMHERIAGHLVQLAAGYFGEGDFRDRVVAPQLGQNAGLQGALLLAGKVISGRFSCDRQ